MINNILNGSYEHTLYITSPSAKWCQLGCIPIYLRIFFFGLIVGHWTGVEHVAVNPQKDLVTVKGTMDAKTLPEYLKKKLERRVEIVPPKKVHFIE